VDYWSNVHYLTMVDDALTVVVTADWDNHDDWPSPIGAPDFTDWQTTYGTSLIGTSTDSNDGTMAATVTVLRAGSHTLSITVDGIHIVGSPISSFEVKPIVLDPTSCVLVDIPEVMIAGYDYLFWVQSRDEYENNKIDLFEDAVVTDYSVVYTNDA
jgi:hypothetical protein